jgi:hypothetical protein
VDATSGADSSYGICGVRVDQSLVVVICGSLLALFSFGHFIVCHSSMYNFWLPLWYLHTLNGGNK